MRICNKCHTKVVRSEKQYNCKDCHNDYQKAFYKRSPTSTSQSFKRRRCEKTKIVQEYKNKPCSDCGIRYPYYVMDFDHVRGKKKFNISIAPNKMISHAIILEEIAKCDVVCANCHRIRTFTK